MVCDRCATQMYKHSYSQAQENGEVSVKMTFKCPNPQCLDYGYKKDKNVQEKSD